MWFGLLGPLCVRHEHTEVPVPASRQRVLLAGLLVWADRIVSADELCDMVWDGSPPAGARVTLRSYIARLRQVLGPAVGSRIVTRDPGYLIQADEDEIDLPRFAALCRLGSSNLRSNAWQQASDALTEALRLWRGAPLADISSQLLVSTEVPRLEQLRLQALEDRIDADLHLGRHTEVIADVQQCAKTHPSRERLHALLMLALYRAGRQAEALAAYQHARRYLLDEFAVEPGFQLRELQQRVLAADPALADLAIGLTRWDRPAFHANSRLTIAAPGSGPRAHRAPLLPRQIPAAVGHFTGRNSELASLDKLLRGQASGQPAVPISVISGTAGVGKTALAVQWAHRVATHFPDGQLFVNLRGFDPVAKPVGPAQAVRGFLHALEVPADRIPADFGAQFGVYRSVVASKRLLVLLDNAYDAEQVRPLLPGTSSSLVVITSRNQLVSLVATEGAFPLPLEVLTTEEARQLLADVLGTERVIGEEQAAAELVALCARLPLALGIAAARAANEPNLALATLTESMHDAARRLDVLDGGDPLASVRVVLSTSYHKLSKPAARMFRLLGLHPGRDFSAQAAASLAGVPLGQALRQLDELVRTYMLGQHAPGRYGCHDLLRAFAAEQASAIDSSAGRRAAGRRLLDHYLHTAYAADRLLYPVRRPIELAALPPGVTLRELTSHGQALAWLEAEKPALLAAVTMAAGSGLDVHAWQLPWALETFFYRRGHWHDWAAAQRAALAAAQRLGDQYAQTQARCGIANAQIELGRPDDALGHLAQALYLREKAGDLAGQARVHVYFSRALEHQGLYREALARSRRSLQLSRAAGEQAKAVQADALNGAGWQLAMLGRYQQALGYCQQALALRRQLGDKHGEPFTLDSIAYSHRHLGHHAEAADYYRRAVELYDELGCRYQKAETLTYVGDACHADGDLPAARETWTQALAILDDLYHPDASQVRTKLARLT
jgi:DNA-binding SARP family transcriptional activator